MSLVHVILSHHLYHYHYNHVHDCIFISLFKANFFKKKSNKKLMIDIM